MGKKVPRKHFFRGIFALGYKDSNLEMTESESFIYDAEKSVFMRGYGLTFSKSLVQSYEPKRHRAAIWFNALY